MMRRASDVRRRRFCKSTRQAVAEKFGATAGLPFVDERVPRRRAAANGPRTSEPISILDISGARLAAMAAGAPAFAPAAGSCLGAVAPTEPWRRCREQIVRRLLTVRGLHNYVPNDLIAAVDFLAEAAPRFPFDALVSRPFALSQVDEAFAEALAGRSLRVAGRPGL